MSDLFAVGLATGLATGAFLIAWSERQRNEIASRIAVGGRLRSAGPQWLSASSKALVVAAIAALAAPLAMFEIAVLSRAADESAAAVLHDRPSSIGEGDVAQLENYLSKVGAGRAVAVAERAVPPLQSQMPQSAASGLPDVDTMIGRLAARLEHAPDDVEGWRTLGWSYLNTHRAGAAVAAYERAAKLAPDRGDITQALAEARAAAATTPATR